MRLPCNSCRKPDRQVCIYGDVLCMKSVKETVQLLSHMPITGLRHVCKKDEDDCAFLHFEDHLQASVFFHATKAKPIDFQNACIQVRPVYVNNEAIKYTQPPLFFGSSLSALPTPTPSTSSVPAPPRSPPAQPAQPPSISSSSVPPRPRSPPVQTAPSPHSSSVAAPSSSASGASPPVSPQPQPAQLAHISAVSPDLLASLSSSHPMQSGAHVWELFTKRSIADIDRYIAFHENELRQWKKRRKILEDSLKDS